MDLKKWFWQSALLGAVLGQYGVLGQSEIKTTSPPSPLITGDPFQGFAIADTTTKPIYCPSGQVFFTSSSFAARCASTSSQCSIATACKDNAVVFRDGATSNCGPLQCQSRKIFATVRVDKPAFVEPLCASVGELDTLFRVAPMASKLVFPLIAADSITGVTAASSIQLTIPSATGNPTPAKPAISPNAGGSVSNQPSSPNLTIAVVAAILGTLALITLILIASWCGRRQGKAKENAENRNLGEWKSRPETRSSMHSSPAGYEAGRKGRSPSPSGPLGLSGKPRPLKVTFDQTPGGKGWI
ncbi:hypothetical protein F4677DRAFT_444972 [Hypoxylon crocopeplum]|nr:hypothetical protein F4677DRAFT_444972 [Hypoxylon crocopeplum]